METKSVKSVFLVIVIFTLISNKKVYSALDGDKDARSNLYTYTLEIPEYIYFKGTDHNLPTIIHERIQISWPHINFFNKKKLLQPIRNQEHEEEKNLWDDILVIGQSNKFDAKALEEAASEQIETYVSSLPTGQKLILKPNKFNNKIKLFINSEDSISEKEKNSPFLMNGSNFPILDNTDATEYSSGNDILLKQANLSNGPSALQRFTDIIPRDELILDFEKTTISENEFSSVIEDNSVTSSTVKNNIVKIEHPESKLKSMTDKIISTYMIDTQKQSSTSDTVEFSTTEKSTQKSIDQKQIYLTDPITLFEFSPDELSIENKYTSKFVSMNTSPMGNPTASTIDESATSMANFVYLNRSNVDYLETKSMKEENTNTQKAKSDNNETSTQLSILNIEDLRIPKHEEILEVTTFTSSIKDIQEYVADKDLINPAMIHDHFDTNRVFNDQTLAYIENQYEDIPTTELYDLESSESKKAEHRQSVDKFDRIKQTSELHISERDLTSDMLKTTHNYEHFSNVDQTLYEDVTEKKEFYIKLPGLQKAEKNQDFNMSVDLLLKKTYQSENSQSEPKIDTTQANEIMSTFQMTETKIEFQPEKLTDESHTFTGVEETTEYVKSVTSDLLSDISIISKSNNKIQHPEFGTTELRNSLESGNNVGKKTSKDVLVFNNYFHNNDNQKFKLAKPGKLANELKVITIDKHNTRTPTIMKSGKQNEIIILPDKQLKGQLHEKYPKENYLLTPEMSMVPNKTYLKKVTNSDERNGGNQIQRNTIFKKRKEFQNDPPFVNYGQRSNYKPLIPVNNNTNFEMSDKKMDNPAGNSNLMLTETLQKLRYPALQTLDILKKPAEHLTDRLSSFDISLFGKPLPEVPELIRNVLQSLYSKKTSTKQPNLDGNISDKCGHNNCRPTSTAPSQFLDQYAKENIVRPNSSPKSFKDRKNVFLKSEFDKSLEFLINEFSEKQAEEGQ